MPFSLLYPLSFKGLSGGSRSAAHSPNEITVFDAPFKISEVAAFALGTVVLARLDLLSLQGDVLETSRTEAAKMPR